MSAYFECLLLIPSYDLEPFWNGESELNPKSNFQCLKRAFPLKIQCSWMSLCGGKLLSVTLRHNDRAARHYLIWANTQLLISLQQWPCTIWCPYMEIICPAPGNEVTFERANILWEDEFFTKSQECHRSGVHNGRAAAFGALLVVVDTF